MKRRYFLMACVVVILCCLDSASGRVRGEDASIVPCWKYVFTYCSTSFNVCSGNGCDPSVLRCGDTTIGDEDTYAELISGIASAQRYDEGFRKLAVEDEERYCGKTYDCLCDFVVVNGFGTWTCSRTGDYRFDMIYDQEYLDTTRPCVGPQ
ncbi:MAG: hypothetical protein K9M08_23230 [Pirellula sp.]|jgi:hypothetical protein|nr:hypothetical protein [Pirellula sp.]